MAIKVAIIGAGSIGFTRRLIQDILAVPELRDTEFGLMDINRRNLDMVARLAKMDIDGNKLPARLNATTERRKALEGADYVLNLTRIGGLDAFQLDVDIPLKYGVDQCVGDTLCIGGVMYGQRNVPAILDFCNASISVQRLAVEAAVHGDVALLKQAAMLDPLTGAVCDPNEISQMVDEMLVAQARWLPQYRDEIGRARRRLKTEKRLGTRSMKGAARIKTRSVAEMRRNAEEARHNAQAADKAAATRARQTKSR